MTFRKAKLGGVRSGGPVNLGAKKLKEKPILTDRPGRVQRLVPMKQPTSNVYPGLFPSGKRARPTGRDLEHARIIVVGSKNIAPPLSGATPFF